MVEWRAGRAMPHSRSSRFHLGQLGLLIGGENRIESCIGLCLGRRRLSGKVADGVCRLRNAIGVVVLDRRSQTVMRGLHAVVHAAFRGCGRGKDSERLLLLLRSER